MIFGYPENIKGNYKGQVDNIQCVFDSFYLLVVAIQCKTHTIITYSNWFRSKKRLILYMDWTSYHTVMAQ